MDFEMFTHMYGRDADDQGWDDLVPADLAPSMLKSEPARLPEVFKQSDMKAFLTGIAGKCLEAGMGFATWYDASTERLHLLTHHATEGTDIYISKNTHEFFRMVTKILAHCARLEQEELPFD